MQLDDYKKEFMISEFTDRRAQILTIIKQMDDNERYSLIVTGVFWAWVAAQKPQPILQLITWIPIIIVGYFFIKWFLLRKSMSNIAAYVKRVEEVFELPQGLGWEHRDTFERKYFNFLYWIYWILILFANSALAVIAPIMWLQK